MSLLTKSYDVTIQMKALCLYLHMVLFVCQNFRQRNLEFGRNLPLATFGSERVKDRVDLFAACVYSRAFAR